MWYGNARHPARDTPSGTPRGRVIGVRNRFVSAIVRDAEPIGTALMSTLAMASLTWSPMANGNGGGVTQNIGSGIVGRDGHRTPALQEWRGAGAPRAADKRRSALGIQAGPSSQPAYPSTGNTQTPSLINPLTGLDTPYALRSPGL